MRCSHASTVGPVDEDQRYYLESRGVPPERAERLIVLGFFDDIVDRSPIPSVVGRMRQEVGIRLADALGLNDGTAGAGLGSPPPEEPAITGEHSGSPGGQSDRDG